MPIELYVIRVLMCERVSFFSCITTTIYQQFNQDHPINQASNKCPHTGMICECNSIFTILTFILSTLLVSIVLILSWMLLHPANKASIARLFGFGRPVTHLTRPISSSRCLSRSSTSSYSMFSKAAKNAAPARAHLTMNDYAHPNISRHSSTNTPLNHITGNTLKRPASHSTSIDQQHHNKSARRSNSGLARVLSSNNGWDDCVISNKSRTNQAATTDKYKSGPYNVGDSFEEDYNLEEKQLTAHDAVSYPDLSRLVEEDALPPSSWDQIPWTSSPVSHFQPKEPQINLNSFRHNRQAVPTKREEPSSRAPVKAASRRKLPWGPGEEEAKTPKGNSGYGWDMSASLMKKQKNTLREINSKRVKTTEKENSEEVARDNLKKSRVSSIFLSDEQRAVLAMVLGDESKNIKPKSIFFTGSAGTGKSVLLREIIAALRKQYHKEPDRVAITASTGLAACNIGGITLHSFAGIGLGNSSTAELIKKIKRNQKAKHRWLRTKVLIMDEVSMLDGDLYDKLEEIARTLKNNGRAFGGIQVIMTGDFFQLPPVPEKGKAAKFAFHANTWSTTIEKTIALNKVFRQKDPGK